MQSILKWVNTLTETNEHSWPRVVIPMRKRSTQLRTIIIPLIWTCGRIWIGRSRISDGETDLMRLTKRLWTILEALEKENTTTVETGARDGWGEEACQLGSSISSQCRGGFNQLHRKRDDNIEGVDGDWNYRFSSSNTITVSFPLSFAHIHCLYPSGMAVY